MTKKKTKQVDKIEEEMNVPEELEPIEEEQSSEKEEVENINSAPIEENLSQSNSPKISKLPKINITIPNKLN